MNKASVRSKKKLEGVDSRLVLLVGYALAISPVDGKAIDVYYVGWESDDSLTDDRWYILIESFKKAGKMLGLKLRFGYDWGWDNPHIELR